MSAQKEIPRILCIDDDPNMIATLVDVLSLLPAQVDIATNGKDAVNVMVGASQKGPPIRLVVLDRWIPKSPGGVEDPSGGFDLLAAIPRRYQLLDPRTPMIVFTGHPTYEDCVDSIRAGAVDYIPKSSHDSEQNNVEALFQRCKALLYPEPRRDEVSVWLDKHIDQLTRQFGGKIVGLVTESDALEAGIGDKSLVRLDGFVIVPGDDYADVRASLLKYEVMRLKKPAIINVPLHSEAACG
jgi:CheY-like chemotaxis protein